jgi:hypothetical protein
VYLNKCSDKEGTTMVNVNVNRFIKAQHKGEYLGSDRNQMPGLNDPDYNNRSNTDKSVGATGRRYKG